MKTAMTNHASETDLALLVSGDLPFWPRLWASVHVRSCAQCRDIVEDYRAVQQDLRVVADQLPASLDPNSTEWLRLQAEMTANIHLGLEASECIAPFETRRARPSGGVQSYLQGGGASWRPAMAGAGIAFSVVLLLGSAWWLNVPASDVAVLKRAFGRMVGNGALAQSDAAQGALVEASSSGVESRQNGGSMGMHVRGSLPVAVSVSFEGSASAHYVDAETGQVTVNTVYAQ